MGLGGREGRIQMIKDNRPILFRTERTEQRQMNKKELIKENLKAKRIGQRKLNKKIRTMNEQRIEEKKFNRENWTKRIEHKDTVQRGLNKVNWTKRIEQRELKTEKRTKITRHKEDWANENWTKEFRYKIYNKMAKIWSAYSNSLSKEVAELVKLINETERISWYLKEVGAHKKGKAACERQEWVRS